MKLNRKLYSRKIIKIITSIIPKRVIISLVILLLLNKMFLLYNKILTNERFFLFFNLFIKALYVLSCYNIILSNSAMQRQHNIIIMIFCNKFITIDEFE